MSTFRALIAEGSADRYVTHFKDLTADALPPGDLLIEVAYSSLDYKDALAVTGRGTINLLRGTSRTRCRRGIQPSLAFGELRLGRLASAQTREGWSRRSAQA
jgi:hypothetical protein